MNNQVNKVECVTCGFTFIPKTNTKNIRACSKICYHLWWKKTPKGKACQKRYKMSKVGKLATKRNNREYKERKLFNKKSNTKNLIEEYKKENLSSRQKKSRRYCRNYAKKYYKKHHLIRKKLKKINKKDRLEKIKECGKKYRQSEKGKLLKKKINAYRRSKEKKIKHNFSILEWFLKKYHTHGFCPNCDKYVGLTKLTLDHIIPLSKVSVGFVYTINDVQPLCFSCNSAKKDKFIFPKNYSLKEEAVVF